MKGFTKLLLTSAAVLFGVGSILALAGWAMGGQTSMTVNVGGRNVNVGIHGIYTASSDWGSNSVKSASDLETFENLEIDISLGDVYLIPSDKFALSMSWQGEKYELHYTNEKGTLKIWSQSPPNLGINLNMNYDATVMVYIPGDVSLNKVSVKTALGDTDLKGFTADTLDLKADLGEVSVSDAVVKNGVMKLSLGDLHMENVTADYLDVTLSMGDMDGYQISTNKELTVENHMGQVNVEGNFKGKTDITDHMGDVTVTTGLSKDDCGYDLKTSMGDLVIDGVKKKSAATRFVGAHTIIVRNSMGNIELSYN